MQLDVRQDRILKTTKVVSAIIIPILSAAFVLLYLFPTRTRQLWSWTIRPTMSATVMGAGYLAGAYFFFRVVTGRQWHRVAIGFVAITVFATMLGVVTVLYWDGFNHDHLSFWAWALLYFSTPALLPWLWAKNRAQDPHTIEPGERIVPGPIRAVMACVGAAQAVFAAVMFIWPSALLDRAPWELTPTTCRSLSAFVAFPAIVYLAFAVERRWSAFETLIEVPIIAMVLIGIAAIVARDEFTASGVVVWGWRVGLVVALGLLLALRLAMARPVRG